MVMILGHVFVRPPEVDVEKAIDKCHSFTTARATWSIFETADIMDQVAVKGEGLKLSYKVHWGGVDAIVDLPNDPTWTDLLRAGDWAIVKSGDKHHVFIEHFELVSSTEIEMTTGS